jgi:hypothetical protein
MHLVPVAAAALKPAASVALPRLDQVYTVGVLRSTRPCVALVGERDNVERGLEERVIDVSPQSETGLASRTWKVP